MLKTRKATKEIKKEKPVLEDPCLHLIQPPLRGYRSLTVERNPSVTMCAEMCTSVHLLSLGLPLALRVHQVGSVCLETVHISNKPTLRVSWDNIEWTWTCSE